jgi:beta-galactosidase/beta-glucuronidase
LRPIASLIRYGGDFGPVGTPSDEAFCINGLVQPDRLHANPHAFEAKHAQQPVAVEPADATSLTLTEARLRVYNRYGARWWRSVRREMMALRLRSDCAQIRQIAPEIA